MQIWRLCSMTDLKLKSWFLRLTIFHCLKVSITKISKSLKCMTVTTARIIWVFKTLPKVWRKCSEGCSGNLCSPQHHKLSACKNQKIFGNNLKTFEERFKIILAFEVRDVLWPPPSRHDVNTENPRQPNGNRCRGIFYVFILYLILVPYFVDESRPSLSNFCTNPLIVAYAAFWKSFSSILVENSSVP